MVCGAAADDSGAADGVAFPQTEPEDAMADARLTEISWPDFGAPDLPPPVTRAELAARLALIRAAMAERETDALVIYGDREHSANILWASGFDPRFEEALMVIRPEGAPLLLAGNECLSYTSVSPAVAAGDIRAELCASLSLISQPRGGATLEIALRGAVAGAGRIGAAGWKYWTAEEVADPEHALDVPSLVADILRETGADVVNAAEVFMHPGHGLRAVVGVDEIARMEFANHAAASAMRRMVFAIGGAATDFDVAAAGAISGLPQGCHMTLATGRRAHLGLSSPSGEPVERGRPLSLNVCHWGANICRAGWVAEGPDDLPREARDYLGAFVGPYVSALSEWCAMMKPGTIGGAVQARMDEMLPFAIFGVTLNPGHLIGTDEWISSPIYPDSVLPLASGMAMQCDVIPGSETYGSTRMEDGYVIADLDLTDALNEAHPGVLARCLKRQSFMRDQGFDVPDTLLPLADTCGVVAPFLLAPRQVVSLKA